MEMAISIEKRKCIGCYACVVACKLEHNLPPYPARPPQTKPGGPSLIQIHHVGPVVSGGKVHQYFQPITCVHCAHAPCIEACPTSALFKETETGITLVDRERCIGCKLCLSACPFGAPQFHEGKLVLCDLCHHRIKKGGEEKRRKAACEAACPAEAIRVGTLKEISALKGKEVAERGLFKRGR